MSHKTLLLFLLYCGAVWGDLKLPVATRSDVLVMKRPFTSHGDLIWPAGCGRGIKVKSSTVRNGGGDHIIPVECNLVMNHIFHYNTTALGRFENSHAGLCSLGTILMCVSHASANPEICASNLKTMDGSSVQSDANGVTFTSQPTCPSKFIKGEDISIRFLSQSPTMKKFQALGGDGGDCRALGILSDDILVKSKAMPRSDDAAEDNEDYLPGQLQKSYKKIEPCGGGCIHGRDMVFNASENAVFEAVFYPKSQCHWARLCVNAIYDEKAASGTVKCEKKNMITFLFDNGLVFTGLRKTAHVLKMHQSSQFSRIQIGRANKDYIQITTGYRERIVLPPLNTEKMWLQMSNEDCFKQFAEFPGYGSVLDIQGNVKIQAIPPCVNKKEVAKMEKIVDVTLVPPETPPKEDQDIGVTAAETKRPDEVTEAGSRGLRQMENPEEDEQAAMRGWLTWAIFYGFLAGTFTGFLICILIFFLARRAIYQDWYRAMYQRYQTDASGTTGGETGAAFTSGDTTTAGHMTTVGATTACENGVTGASVTTGTNSAMSSVATTPSGAQTPNESKQTTSMITM